MRREITAAWETEEVRRERPSPLDEVRSALAVFEETLWDALPLYCRSLDRTLRQSTGRGLPLDAAPIRFGSWIGGDRDGNPFVTPEVTRSACLMARWTGLSLYAKEIEQLRFELSMSDATPELRAQVEGAHEPYRALLRALQQRVDASRRHIEELLRAVPAAATVAAGGYTSRPGFTWEPEMFEPVSEFMEPLLLCHRSLHATGNGLIADGRLTDVLRRMAAFGLTLVRLDVRQEAERHTEAVDAITRTLGLGEYRCWTEERRRGFSRQRPDARPQADTGADAHDPARGRSARHVPHDGGGASRIARRLRHHDGRKTVRCPRRRAPAARSRHHAAAPCRPALRDGARPARRRGHDRHAAGHPVVSRPRDEARGPAGGDGRLLGFRQGRRPAGRGLGALQGAGVHRRDAVVRTVFRSRSSTAGAAASAAAADQPTSRFARSRPDRSTARCASPSRAR